MNEETKVEENLKVDSNQLVASEETKKDEMKI